MYIMLTRGDLCPFIKFQMRSKLEIIPNIETVFKRN